MCELQVIDYEILNCINRTEEVSKTQLLCVFPDETHQTLSRLDELATEEYIFEQIESVDIFNGEILPGIPLYESHNTRTGIYTITSKGKTVLTDYLKQTRHNQKLKILIGIVFPVIVTVITSLFWFVFPMFK